MVRVVFFIYKYHVSLHEVISSFLLAWSDLLFGPSLWAEYAFLVCRIRCEIILLILIAAFQPKLTSVCSLLLWSHGIHFFTFFMAHSNDDEWSVFQVSAAYPQSSRLNFTEKSFFGSVSNDCIDRWSNWTTHDVPCLSSPSSLLALLKHLQSMENEQCANI